jgi:hypothetical protein
MKTKKPTTPTALSNLESNEKALSKQLSQVRNKIFELRIANDLPRLKKLIGNCYKSIFTQGRGKHKKVTTVYYRVNSIDKINNVVCSYVRVEENNIQVQPNFYFIDDSQFRIKGRNGMQAINITEYKAVMREISNKLIKL